MMPRTLRKGKRERKKDKTTCPLSGQKEGKEKKRKETWLRSLAWVLEASERRQGKPVYFIG